MSLRLKLPLHGRSHRSNGSDPIGTFIEYDVENVGDWLYIKTTGSGGPLNRGVTFEFDNTGAVEFHTTDGSVDFDLLMDVYDFTLQVQNISLTTIDPNAGSTGAFTVNAGRNVSFNMLPTWHFEVASGTGSNFVVDNDTDITASPTEDFIVQLLSGQKVKVLDSSTNPIFEVREDGTVHTKTGSTIIADL